MSASRDKNQKFTFVYSNLYQIYRKGVTAAEAASVPAQIPASPQARPEREPAVVAPSSSMSSASGRVLKSADQRQGASQRQGAGQRQGADPRQVQDYQPMEFVAKRLAQREATALAVAPKAAPAQRPAQSETLHGLKQNLETLNELHSRLKFMLQELEDLVKKA